MAHFYGGISGSRGPATRMGSKDSGFSAYAQGWLSRISIIFHYNRADHDDASISIGPGPSGHGGSHTINLDNIDQIVAALDTSDPKIMRIWNDIQSGFDKLKDEAPAALARKVKQEQRVERAQRRIAKEHKRMQSEIIANLKPGEKARIVRMLTPDVQLDANGDFLPEGLHLLKSSDYGDVRQTDMGAVLISAHLPGFKRPWQRFPFDVTNGKWVFANDPDFYGITHDLLVASGFEHCVYEPVAA